MAEDCSDLTLPPLVSAPSIAAYHVTSGDLDWYFRGGDGVPTGDYIWATCNPITRLEANGATLQTTDAIPGSSTHGTGGNPPQAPRTFSGSSLLWSATRVIGHVAGSSTGYLTFPSAGTARLTRFDDGGLVDHTVFTYPSGDTVLQPVFSDSELFLPTGISIQRVLAGDSISPAILPASLAVHPSSDLLAMINGSGPVHIRDWAGALLETVSDTSFSQPAWLPDGTLYCLATGPNLAKISSPYDALTDLVTFSSPALGIGPRFLIPHPSGFLFVISVGNVLSGTLGNFYVSRIEPDLSQTWSVEIPGSPTNSLRILLAYCVADSGLFLMIRNGNSAAVGTIHHVSSSGVLNWTRELRGNGPDLTIPVQAVFNPDTDQIIVSAHYQGHQHWDPQ